jgi:nitronate monooxygenase
MEINSVEPTEFIAPMAGGPSTPELAAAATNTGGLGFIAAGFLPADAFAERIVAARKLTSGPLGVNLFVPQPSAGTPAKFIAYAAALAAEAEHCVRPADDGRDAAAYKTPASRRSPRG